MRTISKDINRGTPKMLLGGYNNPVFRNARIKVTSVDPSELSSGFVKRPLQVLFSTDRATNADTVGYRHQLSRSSPKPAACPSIPLNEYNVQLLDSKVPPMPDFASFQQYLTHMYKMGEAAATAPASSQIFATLLSQSSTIHVTACYEHLPNHVIHAPPSFAPSSVSAWGLAPPTLKSGYKPYLVGASSSPFTVSPLPAPTSVSTSPSATALYTLKINQHTPKSEHDFLVLNLSRASADASVLSGALLRSEPHLSVQLLGRADIVERLKEWRQYLQTVRDENSCKHMTTQPLHCALTSRPPPQPRSPASTSPAATPIPPQSQSSSTVSLAIPQSRLHHSHPDALILTRGLTPRAPCLSPPSYSSASLMEPALTQDAEQPASAFVDDNGSYTHTAMDVYTNKHTDLHANEDAQAHEHSKGCMERHVDERVDGLTDARIDPGMSAKACPCHIFDLAVPAAHRLLRQHAPFHTTSAAVPGTSAQTSAPTHHTVPVPTASTSASAFAPGTVPASTAAHPPDTTPGHTTVSAASTGTASNGAHAPQVILCMPHAAAEVLRSIIQRCRLTAGTHICPSAESPLMPSLPACTRDDCWVRGMQQWHAGVKVWDIPSCTTAALERLQQRFRSLDIELGPHATAELYRAAKPPVHEAGATQGVRARRPDTWERDEVADTQQSATISVESLSSAPQVLLLSVYRGPLHAGAQAMLVGDDADITNTLLEEACVELPVVGTRRVVDGAPNRLVSLTSPLLDAYYELQCPPFHQFFGREKEYSSIYSHNPKLPGWTFYLLKKKSVINKN